MLGIAHYTLDFRGQFEKSVVSAFAADYAAGRTPNPCVACNDLLKFSDLLARVSAQGADALATGHYARLIQAADGSHRLARALDPAKDQSYFLYRLTVEQMAHTLFPLGELTKPEVRAIAARLGLPTAAKAESQDTCFATSGSHLGVVRQRAASAFAPGDIVDAAGRVLGRHEGLAHFTVGQRKGLGIGGLEQPLYVVAIDARTNSVIVGGEESLLVSRVECSDVVWHARESATEVQAMVRYRMAPVPALSRIEGDSLVVEFAEPVRGVAPGQALVCYRGDIVIGGGTVQCAS